MTDRRIELDPLETILDDLEASQRTEQQAQKERSERGFREGRYTSWEDLKSQNGL